MVNAFSYRLNHKLADLLVAPGALHDIQADEIKLAGLQLPATLDIGTTAVIRESVGQAFVFGFRLITLICAVLSLAGAATAWLMIPQRPSPRHLRQVGHGDALPESASQFAVESRT